MKYYAILAAILLSLFGLDELFAQAEAKLGYYVTNEGDTLKRRIRFSPNMTTAKSIFIKTSAKGKFEEINISDVRAFSIQGFNDYERQITLIDKSSNNIEDLVDGTKDKIEVDTVFLQKLVDGPVKILIYSDANRGDQFFYQSGSETVKPLVKRLLVDDKMVVRENREYLTTLKSILTCKSVEEADFETLDYTREKIAAITYKHNKCVNPKSPRPTFVKSAFEYHVSVRGGVVYNKLDFNGSLRLFQLSDANLISGFGYQVGAQIEVVPPIYQQPISFIAEPTLFGYTGDNLSEEKPDTETIDADLVGLQVPIGIRVVLLRLEKSKIYASLGISPTVWSKNTIAYNRFDGEQSTTNLQFFFGAGITAKKFSAEFRFNSKGQPVFKKSNYGITQSKLAFIVGYQLF